MHENRPSKTFYDAPRFLNDPQTGLQVGLQLTSACFRTPPNETLFTRGSSGGKHQPSNYPTGPQDEPDTPQDVPRVILNQQTNRTTQKAHAGGPAGIKWNARLELPLRFKTPQDLQMNLKLASKWASSWPRLASILPPDETLFARGSSREHISPKMRGGELQSMLKTPQDASKTAP